MKRLWIPVLSLLLLLALPFPVAASSDKSSVGLGVSLGASFPQNGSDKVTFDDWDAEFNWGFYVNIPVVWTFHITPSTELYKLGDLNATDVSLAFKFIIPAWVIDIYVGVVPGVTTVADDHLFHVGGVAGVSFNLFSNLDLFVEARYKILIEGDHNFRVLHTNAGVLWHF